MKCRIIYHGKTTETEIQPEESLLEAAIRAGVEPPYSCLEGICGTCEARLLEGEVISPFEESEDKIIRTCMTRPKSDLTISYDLD